MRTGNRREKHSSRPRIAANAELECPGNGDLGARPEGVVNGPEVAQVAVRCTVFKGKGSEEHFHIRCSFESSAWLE